ncbi:unnamed protein product [Peniophora sp. CBMAI 1063]|nr:unnamed protein product [Peniophora sp. CBMAI 1063]
MSEATSPPLIFPKLPVELVSLIISWAQCSWHHEHFSAQAPYADVKRYLVQASQTSSAPSEILPCCNGTRWDFGRPSCIMSGLPVELPSPAYRAAQVSRRLRAILLDENTAIWELDNVLYKPIAERSMRKVISDGRVTMIGPGARNLIALDVCTCLLGGLSTFFASLERVKLRLPWSSGHPWESELRDFLYENRGRAGSALRYIDVEALESPLRAPGPRRMYAIESIDLLTSRFSCLPLYYVSKALTSLYLHQNPATVVEFDVLSISTTFGSCAGTLQHLTIDIAKGFQVDGGDIEGVYDFPNLRYFRLCTSPISAATVLAAMILPYAIDLHIEPVESWRRYWRGYKHRHLPYSYEAPFAKHYTDNREALQGWNPDDFAQSIAQPERTFIIHANPVPTDLSLGLPSPGEAIWQRSSRVMGLDVRIDPCTKPSERAAMRFPELVSVTFAESVDELRPVLQDPVARDWQRSQALDEKTAARRSLTFRDGQYRREDREQDWNPNFPKALYDTLRHVLRFVPGERVPGCEGRVQELVFAKDTWLPDRSLGYEHILERFTGLKALHFDSPPLSSGTLYTQNMEGCLTAGHIDALTVYLNNRGADGAYPCLCLETVHFQSGLAELQSQMLPSSSWESIMNSPCRLAAGALQIRVVEAQG